MNIAIILTIGRDDSLADTILDGMHQLPDVVFRTSDQEGFFDFAKTADLILLIYGKKKTDVELAERIGRWDKTVFMNITKLTPGHIMVVTPQNISVCIQTQTDCALTLLQPVTITLAPPRHSVCP